MIGSISNVGGSRLVTASLIVATLGCVAQGSTAKPKPKAAGAPAANVDEPGVSHRLPWHGKGVWLHGDLHIHNLLEYDDERSAIAAAAAGSGLDFIVSTEHAQHAIDTESKTALRELRRRFFDIIILAGVEWNVPAAGHASVVVERSPDEWQLLEQFTKKFDRKVYRGLKHKEPDHGTETWGVLERAKDGLHWLDEQRRRGGLRTAVYLNHPSRRNYLTDDEINQLAAAGLDGIEASPGHQRRDPPGTPNTIDRHEPYVAVVGGGYDRLLAGGGYLGLSAGSDFHIVMSSHLPGFFSRSLVYCPGRSAGGIVEGLAAGATATVVGRIVRSVETRTTYAELDDFALISETLNVPRGAKVTYSIDLDVSEVDSEGNDSRIDQVEIISNCLSEPAVVHTFEGVEPGTATLSYELPAEATSSARNCYLRARGRKRVGGEGNDLANADLLFYVAATRINVL